MRAHQLKLLYAISFSILFGLACGTANLSQYLPATSTTPMPTTPVIGVTIVYLGAETGLVDDPQPTKTARPITPLPLSDTFTPIPAVIPTDTPVRPTATPSPLPTSTLQPTPTSGFTSTLPITALPTEAITGQPSGSATPTGAAAGYEPITLVELQDDIELAPDVGRVEFKWVWNEAGVCEALPEDRGFDIRIWPDLPGYAPMGVADVKEAQAAIVCDKKSNTRSFEVGHLRNTAAIQAVGSGQFRWEIAVVELSLPFSPIVVSKSRTFRLPSDPTTPTPTPTLIPRVGGDCPCDEPGGEIILIDPSHEAEVPPTVKTIGFKWHWTGAGGCEWPPEGYGFEVRIWPEQPGFQPMGVMGDAREHQHEISCDPANNFRSYLLPDFKNAPGVKKGGAAGRFYWDVVLFQEEPYYFEVIVSETRILVLPGES